MPKTLTKPFTPEVSARKGPYYHTVVWLDRRQHEANVLTLFADEAKEYGYPELAKLGLEARDALERLITAIWADKDL